MALVREWQSLDDIEASHFLLLSMLVLQNLSHIALQLGSPDEAHKYYRELGCLCTAFLSMERPQTQTAHCRMALAA
jgi:hypothetical protein